MVKGLQLIYEKKQAFPQFEIPKIFVLVTGKGPQKEMYQDIFTQKNKEWKGLIKIQTAWLEIDDYPKVVAAADLGVCLHYSSSGFDLPMKVVDMFSAQLPCLAYDYLAIGELVVDGMNGKVFENSEKLSDWLQMALKGFDGTSTDAIRKWKQHLKEFAREDWDAQWERVMINNVIRDN